MALNSQMQKQIGRKQSAVRNRRKKTKELVLECPVTRLTETHETINRCGSGSFLTGSQRSFWQIWNEM